MNAATPPPDAEYSMHDWWFTAGDSTLHAEMQRVLNIRRIITPISDVVGFEPTTGSGTAAKALQENRYDFGSVTTAGRVVGRVALVDVARAPARSPLADYVQPISDQTLVSADSGISRLMRWLSIDPWLFVVDGNRVAGIVTPSDLNRQAARAYFYLLVADFEIRLSDTIREVFRDQWQALDLLSERRRSDIRARYDDAVGDEVETDLVAAMDLHHLLDIGSKSGEVRARFGMPVKARWKQAVGAIPGFRNSIMHPTRPVLSDRSGLERLIAVEERLASLVTPSEGRRGSMEAPP